MTITLSDEELRNYRATLVAHYQVAINTYDKGIAQFLTDTQLTQFNKELKELQEQFTKAISNPPKLASF